MISAGVFALLGAFTVGSPAVEACIEDDRGLLPSTFSQSLQGALRSLRIEVSARNGPCEPQRMIRRSPEAGVVLLTWIRTEAGSIGLGLVAPKLDAASLRRFPSSIPASAATVEQLVQTLFAAAESALYEVPFGVSKAEIAAELAAPEPRAPTVLGWELAGSVGANSIAETFQIQPELGAELRVVLGRWRLGLLGRHRLDDAVPSRAGPEVVFSRQTVGASVGYRWHEGAVASAVEIRGGGRWVGVSARSTPDFEAVEGDMRFIGWIGGRASLRLSLGELAFSEVGAGAEYELAEVAAIAGPDERSLVRTQVFQPTVDVQVGLRF